MGAHHPPHGVAALDVLNGQPARACPKGVTRKTLKGRKDRAEAAVKRDVRAACVERDGDCILQRGGANDFTRGDVLDVGLYIYDCHGESQWCHAHPKRRSKTRGTLCCTDLGIWRAARSGMPL